MLEMCFFTGNYIIDTRYTFHTQYLEALSVVVIELQQASSACPGGWWQWECSLHVDHSLTQPPLKTIHLIKLLHLQWQQMKLPTCVCVYDWAWSQTQILKHNWYFFRTIIWTQTFSCFLSQWKKSNKPIKISAQNAVDESVSHKEVRNVFATIYYSG